MIKSRRRLAAGLAVLFLLNILIIVLFQSAPRAQAAVYKEGSRGETVRTIQTKLKNWGYYSGNADGIFGPLTTKAVKYFQRRNSLSQDGVVGAQTLRALGIYEAADGGNAAGASENSVALLAKVISAEARGEPFAGQVAVGAVIMNRVRHPSFPGTIYGVVYQPGAFSCMLDGQINQPVAESAYRAAREALNGSDPSGGAIYYFNPNTATSAWIWSRPLILVIGNHRFCS